MFTSELESCLTKLLYKQATGTFEGFLISAHGSQSDTKARFVPIPAPDDPEDSFVCIHAGRVLTSSWRKYRNIEEDLRVPPTKS